MDYCLTPDLDLLLEVDFTFAWDNNNRNKNKNPNLNFLKGTVLGDKEHAVGIRNKRQGSKDNGCHYKRRKIISFI